MSAHRISAAKGRLRRSVEQQELWGRFVDKVVEQKIGEEAAPAARRDESGPIALFGTAAASRREPTGEPGAAAPFRAASEASESSSRPAVTWQLQRRDTRVELAHIVTRRMYSALVQLYSALGRPLLVLRNATNRLLKFF